MATLSQKISSLLKPEGPQKDRNGVPILGGYVDILPGSPPRNPNKPYRSDIPSGQEWVAGGTNAINDQRLRDADAARNATIAANNPWSNATSQARGQAQINYWSQHPDQMLANDLNPMLGPANNLRDAMNALNGGGGSGGSGGSGGGGLFGGGGGTGNAGAGGSGGYAGMGGAGGIGGGSLAYMMGGGSAAPTPPDMTASNAATFGRAKDQAGQTGRASLTSLRDELGVSGMLGSGAEVQGVRDITQDAAGQVGQVTRDQAVNDSSQKADFAKLKYQGDISMRGQDVQAQGDMARIKLQKELAQQSMLQAALAGLAQAY